MNQFLHSYIHNFTVTYDLCSVRYLTMFKVWERVRNLDLKNFTKCSEEHGLHSSVWT